MEKKGTSWGLIIFLLIIFWPVGIVLLIKKLATDKSAMMSGKTGVFSFIGGFLILLGIMFLFAKTDDGTIYTQIILAVIFCGGGGALVRLAIKTKKTSVKYKKYIDMVVNQEIKSIDTIASAMGLSYKVVSADLQKMIDAGYLGSAFIHQANREIVLKHQQPVFHAQTQTQTPVYGQAPVQQAPPQTKSVRCPGCGANNVATVGVTASCEYCGTPINA